MISLLNPSLAPWLAAASIPVVIHLLTRRTRRRLDLPTVSFLKTSLARQSRVYRLRHLLLLLLRTLAVTAIVLAFLKPTIQSALGSSGSEHSVTILLIDSSASMGYSEGGTSSFSRARNDALKVLEELRPGDSANVIFTGALPQPVLSQPGDDLAGLERAVRDAHVTDERADPMAALNVAVDQISHSKEKVRRIYMFSDFQRTNWANVKFDGVPAATKLVFAAASPDRPQNAGITAIHLFPASPRVGEPITAECDVFNSGDAVRTVPVTLTLPDGSHSTQSVTAAPYASASAAFSLKFSTPAQIECVFSIPPDNLKCDDTRRAVIDLSKMPNVTLITEDDVSSPHTGSFFLVHALHPDPAGQAGFHVAALKPSDLNNPALHAADAVIVCNAPHMPPVQYQALAKYITEGGSVLWFLSGSDISAQITSLAGQLPEAEPLPFTIQGVQDLSGNGKGYVTLAEAHYDSPLLKVFKDPAAADLGQIHFRKICLTSEVDPRAETLLKYDDGTAAAIRCGEGSGNLLIINMSPNPEWSDMAKQDAFVPMLHEFLKGLSSKNAGSREFSVGGSAAATIGGGSEGRWSHITCAGPSGETPVTADPVTGSVVIDRTKEAGFYHLSADGRPSTTLAVNVNADESDLRPIDPRELESDAVRRNSVLTGAAGADADVAGLNQGRPLWHYLLLGALLCLCAEVAVGSLKPKVRN